MGGYDNNKSPPRSDQIQYWASATTGNALDFGNLTQVKEKTDGVVGDATRAVVGGGYGASNSVINEMDYIAIQTTGNAQDFGDLTQARDEIGNTNDATRGVFIGGEISGQVNTIDYITTQTTANASDFGDTTNSVYGCHSGICADTPLLPLSISPKSVPLPVVWIVRYSIVLYAKVFPEFTPPMYNPLV